MNKEQFLNDLKESKETAWSTIMVKTEDLEAAQDALKYIPHNVVELETPLLFRLATENAYDTVIAKPELIENREEFNIEGFTSGIMNGLMIQLVDGTPIENMDYERAFNFGLGVSDLKIKNNKEDK